MCTPGSCAYRVRHCLITSPNVIHSMFERTALTSRTTDASFAIVGSMWHANDTIQAPAFDQRLDPVLFDVQGVRGWAPEVQGALQGFSEVQPRRDITLEQVMMPTATVCNLFS